jgi:hypothetical protein
MMTPKMTANTGMRMVKSSAIRAVAVAGVAESNDKKQGHDPEAAAAADALDPHCKQRRPQHRPRHHVGNRDPGEHAPGRPAVAEAGPRQDGALDEAGDDGRQDDGGYRDPQQQPAEVLRAGDHRCEHRHWGTADVTISAAIVEELLWCGRPGRTSIFRDAATGDVRAGRPHHKEILRVDCGAALSAAQRVFRCDHEET